MEEQNSAPPVDLYAAVHRGLRWSLSDLMLRLGNADLSSCATRAALVDDLESVVYLLERHIDHEDRHIHPLLAQLFPTQERRLAQAHREHEAALSQLVSLAGQIDDRQGDIEAQFETLYLEFSVFVAHNLEHMAEEELRIAPLLTSHFSQRQLQDVHDAIIADIGPDEMKAFVRSMLPAVRPEVRQAMMLALPEPAPSSALPA